MRISFETFRGERPKLSSHKLDNSMAQLASNCRLIKGDLRAFKSPKKDVALSLTAVKTLFNYEENSNEHWVESANDLDFVKSPISDDTYERVYYTGETEPRFFANDNVSTPFDATTDYYKLGIPVPATDPTIGAGTGTDYRAYVYSYVNSYGDEGAPTGYTSISTLTSGDTITVSNISNAPADRSIDQIYLYRTNSSGEGSAEFQYVLSATWFLVSVAYAVGDFVVYSNALYKCTATHSAGAWNGAHFTAGDDVADSALLTVFPKTNYDVPPSDLFGIISLSNGTLAGISGKTLRFSEPFQPQAWPTDYRVGFDELPVGLGAYGNTVIVTTEGKPYPVYGTHPSTMSKSKKAPYYPCISKRGIVSDRSAVFYPTNEGLVRANINGFSIVTETVMSKEDWGEYNPDTMAGYFYQGKYFGFEATIGSGFVLDFTNDLFFPISVYAHAGYVDDEFSIVSDDISVIDENNPPAVMPLCVMEWEGDETNYLIYTWRSENFILDYNTNFSIAHIVLDEAFYAEVAALVDLSTLNAAIFAGDLGGTLGESAMGTQEIAGDDLYDLGDFSISGSINFRVYADGVLVFDRVIDEDDNKTFRLPGGYASREIYIEMAGYIPVKKIIIATSADEL